MACFCATNLFPVSLGILLWTGEAVGFCASIFETQQGEYRLNSSLSVFEKSSRKAINNNSMTRSEHTPNTYPMMQISVKFKEGKKKENKNTPLKM